MNSQMLDATDGRGRTLRVEFVWLGDRFGHRLFAVERGGIEILLLESIEGTASDTWPASPPLQSLSIESLGPERRAALLVGMAGRSHWSASVEALAGEASFVFDIACRASDGQASLGSTYRGRERQEGSAPPSGEVAVRAADGMHYQTIVSEGKAGSVSIRPAPPAVRGTVRWTYRVELLPQDTGRA